jgi:hypothetical protein
VLIRVPGRELWTSFPEASRKEVLGLLSMLLERLAVSAGTSEGPAALPLTSEAYVCFWEI